MTFIVGRAKPPEPRYQIRRELVEDLIEFRYADGRRYATQRWITHVDDWRQIAGGRWLNFGTVHFGSEFQTPDSVHPLVYEAERAAARPWWKFWR